MTVPESEPLRLVARAKLNLYLHVTGRRSDGFHLLDSLVVFADLADQIELSVADGLDLTVGGPFGAGAGPVEHNLVLRAARALASAAGIPAAAHIDLVKNVPAAAGLGGGSADAAATLRGLARLWGDGAQAVDLGTIAQRLGADVPVCLEGGATFIGGIGDHLNRAPQLPEAGLLLVNPRIELPTVQVFAAYKGGYSSPGRFEEAPATVRDLARLLATRTNDLTGAAMSVAPVLGEVLAAVAALPGCCLARMSGSGATCFGLFEDAPAAIRANAALTGRGDWWTHAGRIVTAA